MDALSGRAPATEAAEGLFQPIDPPPVHVAMLDASGVIVAANDRWAAAARDARSTAGALGTVGSRYHDHCDAAARERPAMRAQLLRLSRETRAVLGGDCEHAFGFVVAERTYAARVLPVRGAGDDLTLVSIADTTEHPGGGAAAAMRDALEALVDALDVAVVLEDLGGRALAWNPSAERILGLTGDQLARRAPIDPRWTLLHEDGLPLPLEQRPSRIAFSTRKPCSEVVLGVRRPDGHVTWAAVGAQPLVRDGEDRPWAVAVSARDVTERRAAETELRATTSELENVVRSLRAGVREAERLRDEAIRAARRGSEFLATMSHEIRTPMNGVIGTVEMLLDTALEAHQRDLAELIRDAGYGLLSIVDDALDLSRIEAEQLEPRLADVDLAAVAEGAADLLLSSARRKGLGLTVYVDPRIPPRLRGDAQWLRQVLVNLGGNAVKFTDEGDVEMRVELEAQTGGASAVRFRVIDTGSGIPASERERLFEPFVQLEPGGGRRRGGTGLGLAICRRLVRLMGGELVVDSRPARGSTFSFTLTLPRSVGAGAAGPERRPARPLRVLVVEPRETLAAIAAEYLAASGIATERTSSAEAACECARAATAAGAGFDVAIVGIGHAEASVAAAELLRATPGCEAIALVMLNEVGAPAAASEGLFARELTRPLKRAQLYDAVVAAAGAEAPEPRRDERPERGSAALPAGLRVLVADDNEVNSELLVHQLARLGVDGEAVGGGREAVAAVAERPYDVVLMDARMPGVDGLQAARAIRRLAGERGAVPIVAVTASGTPGERAACLAAGMEEFLPKPISSGALAATLARALERRPPAIAPGAAAIDAAAIARLDSDLGDRAELRRIAAIYLGQLGPGAQAIAAAVAAGEDDALHAAAHRLGSASATFGADGVSELCQRLEALGAAGRAAGADELVRALEDECARAAAELRRLLELR